MTNEEIDQFLIEKFAQNTRVNLVKEVNTIQTHPSLLSPKLEMAL